MDGSSLAPSTLPWHQMSTIRCRCDGFAVLKLMDFAISEGHGPAASQALGTLPRASQGALGASGARQERHSKHPATSQPPRRDNNNHLPDGNNNLPDATDISQTRQQPPRRVPSSSQPPRRDTKSPRRDTNLSDASKPPQPPQAW